MDRNKNRGNDEGKTYALYSEICNVGKTIINSKKRATWKIAIDDTDEHEITLVHSLASGKKIIRLNGSQIHKSQNLNFGDWDYVFNVKGGHMVHLMIKPSSDLNDLYDLIIDNVSFRRLPKKNSYSSYSYHQGDYQESQSKGDSYRIEYNSKRASNVQRPPSSGSSNGRQSGTMSNMEDNKYDRRLNQVDEGANNWVCGSCTLVNHKRHGLVCEACNSPRLERGGSNSIKRPSIRQETLSTRNETSRIPQQQPNRQSTTDYSTANILQHEDHKAFDPFATNSTNPVFNPFESTPVNPTGSHPSNKNDISFDQPFPTKTNKNEDLVSSLAGLDFSGTPVTPGTPITPIANESLNPTTSLPIDDDDNDKKEEPNKEDLWSSKMINLDLKNKVETLQIKKNNSGPSLEQARLMDSKKSKAMLLPASPVMLSPSMKPMGGMMPSYPMTSTTPGGLMSPPSMNGSRGGGFGMNPSFQQPMSPQFGGFPQQQVPSPFGAYPPPSFGENISSPHHQPQFNSISSFPLGRQLSNNNFPAPGQDPFATLR